MQVNDLSVKQMLVIFVIINSLIISFIFIAISPESRSNVPEIKGLSSPTTQFQYDNKAHFKASSYPLNFDFPTELGKATSIFKTNGCSLGENSELISFTNFSDLNIIINECDKGLNMFVPEAILKFENETGDISFIGRIRSNLRSPNTFDLLLVNGKEIKPRVTITGNFNTTEISQEELSVLLGSLIYSMRMN